jgi:predicted RNase H-like HicB family nuclease
MASRASSASSAAIESERVDGVTEVHQDLAAVRDHLEARLERLQEAFASLTVGVVEGYFVKAWMDADSGEWVAECPTVKTVAQAESRELAMEAIGQLTREMLQALADMGAEIPPKDL